MRSATDPFRNNAATSAIACLGFALAVAVWIGPRVTRACSCSAPPPPAMALQNADAVFEARPYGMSTDARRARYTFEVDRVWKGAIGPRVEIVTSLHSASCGRSYEMGTKYVVYAIRSRDGDWSDYLCSRTRATRAAADDLEVLGQGRAPTDSDRPPPADPVDGPTEPPRIDTPPAEPPPPTPSKRGCAVEKPHTPSAPGLLALLVLGVAIGRRRAVG